MTIQMIDVPAGLNGVIAAETAIGAVDGDEGFFHYGGHDATVFARQRSFEDVWFLVRNGRLPSAAKPRRSAPRSPRHRFVARGPAPGGARGGADRRLDAVETPRPCCPSPRAMLGLDPVIDVDDATRRDQTLRLAALMPSILAALHRVGAGLDPVESDPSLGHAADLPAPDHRRRADAGTRRAVEQYMILTIDHGFNASTFTARVVASTGADPADAVCSAIGALAGPLHGGAPSRALDALDAIGTPDRAAGLGARRGRRRSADHGLRSRRVPGARSPLRSAARGRRTARRRPRRTWPSPSKPRSWSRSPN